MQIISGKQNLPPILMVCGEPGIGKSTFASCAPNPLFVTTRIGQARLAHIAGDKAIVEKWSDVKEIFSAMKSYDTLVVDPLNDLEDLILQKIIKDYKLKSHLEYNGGFYQFRGPLGDAWLKFMDKVIELKTQGKKTILIGHTEIKRYEPPTGKAYDRIQLCVDSRTAEYLIRNVDLIGYARIRTITEKGPLKNKIITTTSRELCFEYNAAYPSKTGISFNKPSIPLNWEEYQKTLKESNA